MIFNKKIIEEVKVTYLVVNIPLNPNPEIGPSLYGLPKLDHVNGVLELMINIDTGMIIGWPKSNKEWVISTFVGTNGSYILLDSNTKVISKIKEGEYGVPNKLLPSKEGLSDYLLLNIDNEGFITNWYSNPSLSEFEELQK